MFDKNLNLKTFYEKWQRSFTISFFKEKYNKIKLIRKAVKVDKKCHNNTIFYCGGGSKVIITLFILCMKWLVCRDNN